MKIFKKIKANLEKQLPFVVYRKPNATNFFGLFQQNDELYYTKNYLESGFVFAPFDDENKAVLIPENQSEYVEETVGFNVEIAPKTVYSSDEKAKKQHIAIVEKAIKAIKKNEFIKVVISRKEIVCIDDFNVIETFKKLVSVYKTAMVYVWFHPKVGLWFGATPETLLKVAKKKFETMSLAGTQVYNGTTNITWQPKEINEQQVVTDYIVSNLQPISKNINICNTETVQAGSLLHLRTKISGELTATILELILALHPTPAVCGYPKEKAKQFIIDNEKYHRSFYTGFLGELNIKGLSELYVNLRCMQIEDEKASLYVGGGVTISSNSAKEWEETVAKTKTMKQVF